MWGRPRRKPVTIARRFTFLKDIEPGHTQSSGFKKQTNKKKLECMRMVQSSPRPHSD